MVEEQVKKAGEMIGGAQQNANQAADAGLLYKYVFKKTYIINLGATFKCSQCFLSL